MITEDAADGPVRSPERLGGMVSDAVAGSCAQAADLPSSSAFYADERKGCRQHAGMLGGVIGRFERTVIDCPARALAGFYCQVLGMSQRGHRRLGGHRAEAGPSAAGLSARHPVGSAALA